MVKRSKQVVESLSETESEEDARRKPKGIVIGTRKAKTVVHADVAADVEETVPVRPKRKRKNDGTGKVAERLEEAASPVKRKKKKKMVSVVTADPQDEAEPPPPPRKLKKKKAAIVEEVVPIAETDSIAESREPATRTNARDVDEGAEGDIAVHCVDCDNEFPFTSREQTFFQEKGFHQPTRCKSCRLANSARRSGGENIGRARADETKTVFVRSLPSATTEEALNKDFGECGQIVSCRMVYKEDGTCKGIAFITYATDESCAKALAYNGTDYCGKVIYVVMAGDKGKGKECGENTVCVRGLPFVTTEESLRKEFSECGDIVNCRVVLNEEGSCKGIAFIKYKAKEGCDSALEYDDTDYGGRTIYVAMAGKGCADGKDGKGKGKGGKGKDGKGKDKSKDRNGAAERAQWLSKGKGKKGKANASSDPVVKHKSAIVESTGTKTVLDDSDDE